MSAVGETLLADAIETMVEKVYNAFKDYFVEIEETVERGGDGTECECEAISSLSCRGPHALS